MNTYIARITRHDRPPGEGPTPLLKDVFEIDEAAAIAAFQAKYPQCDVEIVDQKDGNPQNLARGKPT
jgi:hypothetical protein